MVGLRFAVLLPLSVAFAADASRTATAEDAPLLPAIYQCFAADQYFFVSFGSDMTYRQTEPRGDAGLYDVDAAKGIVRFTTGPYAIGQWTAEIHNTPDRHGFTLHADQDYDCRAAR